MNIKKVSTGVMVSMLLLVGCGELLHLMVKSSVAQNKTNRDTILSNVQSSPMEIQPIALTPALLARPFNTIFNRQAGTARSLYGPQLRMPRLSWEELAEALAPLLLYYAQRDRGLITDRVCACILTRQKFL